MNMMKGLLLGSAATIVAVAGAQAADLPVKAKPVEYVKICSAYGVGFYYIPGTDSCIRIGGYLRNDLSFNENNTTIEQGAPGTTAIPFLQRNRDYVDNVVRGAFSFDVRSNTQYGVMRAYYQEYLTTDSQKALTPSLASAYLQLAGFTVGRFIATYNTAWDTDFGNSSPTFTGRDTSQSQGIEYRAQFGGGVSAAIGVFDPRREGIYDRNDTQLAIGSFPNSTPLLQAAGDNMYHMPDVQGDVRVEQAWGGFHFGALLHEVNVPYSGTNNPAPQATNQLETTGFPKTKYGYAFNASLQLTQLPTGAGDKFTISGQYTKGALFTVQGSAPVTSFAIFGPGNNSGFYNSVAWGYFLDGVFDSSPGAADPSIHLTTAYEISGGFEHYWIPAKLRSSITAGWERVHYDAVAANSICNAISAAGVVTSRFSSAPGFNCNPDFTSFTAGSRTAWNVTPDLEIQGEVVYKRFDTASSGFITANTTMVAGKPIGPQNGAGGANAIYNIANQGQFAFFTRVQRSW